MFWRIACFCEPLCSVTALGTGTERWQKNHLIAGSVLDESESVGRCCVPQTPVCLLPPLLLPASRFRNQCGLLLTGVLHDVYRVTNSVLQTVVLCSAHLCVSPPLCYSVALLLVTLLLCLAVSSVSLDRQHPVLEGA